MWAHPDLTFSHQISSAITIFASFAVLFIPRFQNGFTIATSIVHSKLDYCNSITTCPSLRSPSSNWSRTLLHMLLSKLPNQSHHSHPSVSALVKDNWVHWIEPPLTYLQSSQPPNFLICISSSQFSLLTALALHLWSHSLIHPHHLLYE